MISCYEISENKRIGYVAYLFVLFKGGQVYVKNLLFGLWGHKSLPGPVTASEAAGLVKKAR
jgi:hypothetical protein